MKINHPNHPARRIFKLAAAVTLCAGMVPAWAFQPLITDDTGTQGAGGNQIEVAYNRSVDKTPGIRDVTTAFPVVYTRGLTDELDVFVGIAHLSIETRDADTERGLGNVAVGAKWRFYENEASKLSVALKPEILVPVSQSREAHGLGTAEFSYGLGVLLSQETGFGAVHANLAVARVRYDDASLNASERRTLLRLSVAPVWNVTEQWKLALDAGILTNPDRTEKATMGYVEIGGIYSPTRNLDFAIGLVRNVGDGTLNSRLFTAGVTARF